MIHNRTPGRLPRRLYRPADDRQALAALHARVLRHRARWVWIVGILTLLCAGLLLLNSITVQDDPGLVLAQRWWSLVVTLSLGLVVALTGILTLWVHPRALKTQQTLLARWELLETELRLRRTEANVERHLTLSPTHHPELPSLLGACRRSSARLLQSLVAARITRLAPPEGRGAAQDLAEIEERRERARLDAYWAHLANLEVNAALEADFFSSAEALQALEEAHSLLAEDASTTRPALVAPRPVAARHSIAVLPFADLSPGRDQEYLTHGLTEELINALTHFRRLRVIARSSVFSLQGRFREVHEIGRTFGVDTVLEGSVRKEGERLRITVQLVRTRDGLHLWSRRYDRLMGDVFAIQDEITQAVVGELRDVILAAPESRAADAQTVERLRQPPTEDLEAYQLYLKGRYFLSRRTPDELLAAIGYFEQALTHDASYALAYSGLADSCNLLGYYSVLAPQEVFPRAKQAASRALEIDPSLAEAHLSLAFAQLLFDWDWHAAANEFQRTFELSPGYATAHHWFAEYLTFLGRHDEAIEQARQALVLDPLSLIINVLVGWTLYYAQRYDEAIDKLNHTLELNPNFAPAKFWLGLACEQVERFDEARQAFDGAVAGSKRSPMVLAALGRLYAEHGDPDQAQEILRELEELRERVYVPCYYIAALHSGRGDADQALTWLEKACLERDNWMVFLNIDPIWTRYRNEPRFQALLAQVGF